MPERQTSAPASPSPAPQLRFLIVDDHALFRRGFRLFLAQAYPGCGIEEARTIEEAQAGLRKSEPPTLVFLDLVLPGSDRVKGLSRLVEQAPEVPIVVVSAFDDPDEIVTCIRIGARGYISKSANEAVLQHAVSLVLAGETFIPSTVVGRLGGAASGADGGEIAGLPADSPLRSLTRRQRQTLELLIDGHSNKEIARRLGLLESTVKAHIKVILKKLGAQNRTQAALIAARHTPGAPV